MVAFEVRRMTREDRTEVAELIYLSTNAWYQANRHCSIFSGGPSVTEVYFDVYEALDPRAGRDDADVPAGDRLMAPEAHGIGRRGRTRDRREPKRPVSV